MNKRKKLYIGFLSMALVALALSCEKDYKDPARITYFADIVINGDPVIWISTDEVYVDSGAVVTENGVAIEFTTVSTVENDVPGFYTVSYSAKNSDGFSKAEDRQVIVYDANVSTEDISGDYSGSVDRNGTESYSGVPVTLTKIEGFDGIYEISDWISGFYAVGRDYGDDYAFTGIIQINADNEIFNLGMSNLWGDPFDEVVGTYDPVGKVISYSADWLDYVFVVDLTKN